MSCFEIIVRGRLLPVACLTLALTALVAGRQQDVQFRFVPDADRIFQQAIGAYEGGNYRGALTLFDSLIHYPIVHQRTTASYLMKAKSLFALNEYDSSVVVLRTLEKLFPGTTYIDDIRYTTGINFVMLQNDQLAAGLFVQVLNSTPDSILREQANDFLRMLVRERLTPDDLPSLLEKATGGDVKDLIALELIKDYRQNGEEKKAQLLINDRLAADNDSPYRSALLQLQKRSRGVAQYRVGVMLPLMTDTPGSTLHALATELLDGIDFALKEYTGSINPDISVTIDVRDVGMDSTLVVRDMKEWAASPDMLCVIGPLFSNLVANAAPLANSAGLPLITPTATSTGLTRSGRYVFQMSPDYRTRGKALARYAINDLGLKTFAILSTTESMGNSYEGFLDEISRSGGQVLDKQFFGPGVTTIKDQCLAIRKAILGNIPAVDEYDTPATVGGIYVAIDDPEEIGVVASQLAFFNIKGTLLGNNEWYDLSHLTAQRKLIEGISFISDTFLEDRNPKRGSFDAAFTTNGQRPPTKYTYIGYDAMELILSCLPPAKRDRDEFLTRLGQIRDYRGLYSTITFSRDRVNTHLYVLQYRHGEIMKMAELDMQ